MGRSIRQLVSRRDFLKLGSFFGVIGLTGNLAKADQPTESVSTDSPITSGKLSICQHATDTHSTVITVVTSKKGRWSFCGKIAGEIAFFDPKKIEVRSHPSQKLNVTQVYFDQLDPTLTYAFEVYDEDDKILDRRLFKSLDVTAIHQKSVGFFSCSSDFYPVKSKNIWDSFEKTKPDLLISLGDNVYVDSPIRNFFGWQSGVERIWQRFFEVRKTLDLYKWKSLVPIFAIWDDHDFANDRSDSSYFFKKESLYNFESFFPRPTNSLISEKGPGICHRVDMLGLRFIFMDSRFFRLEGPDASQRTHWGKEQFDWLEKNLMESDRPCFIMNGSQMFPASFIDSMSIQHPEDLLRFQKLLSQVTVPVVLFSGDVHFSEVSELESELFGYKTYEITSSALHSSEDDIEAALNSRRKAGAASKNFCIVKTNAIDSKSVSLVCDCYGEKQKLKFSFSAMVQR